MRVTQSTFRRGLLTVIDFEMVVDDIAMWWLVFYFLQMAFQCKCGHKSTIVDTFVKPTQQTLSFQDRKVKKTLVYIISLNLKPEKLGITFTKNGNIAFCQHSIFHSLWNIRASVAICFDFFYAIHTIRIIYYSIKKNPISWRMS